MEEEPPPVHAEAPPIEHDAPHETHDDAPPLAWPQRVEAPEEEEPTEHSPLSAIERLSVTEADLIGNNGSRRSIVLVIAWIVSFAILLILGALAVHKRDQVMTHWPASARIFALFGLARQADSN